MDPDKLRELSGDEVRPGSGDRDSTCTRALGKPVTAVVPVHLYGQMADMDPIMEIGGAVQADRDRRRLPGARRGVFFEEAEPLAEGGFDRPRGSVSAFIPARIWARAVKAGPITTNDPEVARKASMLRDHGQSKKYYHDVEGYNGRLDSMQAGMLRVKLKHLAKWNEQRRASARVYDELFKSMGGSVSLRKNEARSRCITFTWFARHTAMNSRSTSTEAGIGTGIHYPIPVHIQQAYSLAGLEEGRSSGIGDRPRSKSCPCQCSPD